MKATMPIVVTEHAVRRARERIGLARLRFGEIRSRIRADVTEALRDGRISPLVPEDLARHQVELERPPNGCFYVWRPGRDRFYVIRPDRDRWYVTTVIAPVPDEILLDDEAA